MRIAVVGSGIAGLSAAWLLSTDHQVTLFEKFEHLGMDAHSLNVSGELGTARVDVPLRVFFSGFYPNLTALYQKLGVEFEPINYSASFGYLNQQTYFRYDNYKIGRYAVPFLKGRQSMNRKSLRIGWDMLRFFRQSPKSIAKGLANHLTLEDYLSNNHYSTAFAEDFLYPAFAGICTCSYDSIKSYPARVILEYVNSGLLFTAVNRVSRGTEEVVNRLTQNVHTIKLGVQVTGVSSTDNGVAVQTEVETSTFDHVVFATQANQTASILTNASPEEHAMLASFSYEPSTVVVHSDTRLAPVGTTTQWAPVNFVLERQSTTPMATIWMNAIQSMPVSTPVFQTWNPIIDPEPSLVLGKAQFERPVVNGDSLKGLERLARLHQQPDRRIWFGGSYATHGIPLLESATNSAIAIAERLGCSHSWTAVNNNTNDFPA